MSICEQRWGQKDAFLQRSLFVYPEANAKSITSVGVALPPPNLTIAQPNCSVATAYQIGIEFSETKRNVVDFAWQLA